MTAISATVALFLDDLGVIVQVVGAIGAAALQSINAQTPRPCNHG